MHSDFKFKPSGFLTNFSMMEIVKNLKSPSGILCGGSRGGGGTGSGRADDKSAHYRKHDSFGCHIKDSDKEKFDAAEIIGELKEKAENEIERFGLKVTGGDRLTSSSFYLEYAAENITGRVEFDGSLVQNNFQIRVSLSETSTNIVAPLIERPLKVYEPTGNYYVVAFASDDEAAGEFFKKGQKAADESKERFRQKYLADADNFNPENYRTVMYVWTRTPDSLKEKLKDRVERFFELSADYADFDKVYFLNDLALQMYREASEEFEIVKTVPAEEVFQIPYGPSFQSYYVPVHE